MMGHLQNEMKRQALGVVNSMDHARIGIVQNYKPYMCKVLLQPENVLTNWLPIHSAWIGNGWGMFAPPPSGSSVWVVPVEGSLDAAYVLPGFFDNEHQPLATPQGEFWLMHQSGSGLKFNNNGDVSLVAFGALNVTSPQINLNGYVKTNNHVEMADGKSTVVSAGGKALTFKNGVLVGVS